MAVKASAQITLNYIVDIKATYIYYLLQSSTLTAPSKPTTFPPSSEWTNTEPSYTSESTNSLYFVDCTVFCDDTFQYSEVSLSSSYEAAKEAYNKASDAQTRITNAETLIEQNTEMIALRATAQEVNNASSKIEELEAKLDIQKDSISSLIRNGETGSLLKQDSEGLYFFDISSLENDVSKNANEIIGVKRGQEKLETDIDDLVAKTAYIAAGTEGPDDNKKPYIELGDSKSGFTVKITNEQILFNDGQTTPAYISNQKLMIEKAQVDNELRFGNFVWKERKNGNMGLTWEEVSS